MNEQVRNVMAPLMDSVNEHLKKFAENICKQNPSNVLILFVILSKKVLSPMDSGSYFSVTFGTLVVLIKRQFDQYMVSIIRLILTASQESEGKSLNDVKLPKRMRIGIIPQIQQFADLIRNAERIFGKAERRTDLEKWYAHFYRCLSEGINRAAISPYSKSPAPVVRFENYNQLYCRFIYLICSCNVQQQFTS